MPDANNNLVIFEYKVFRKRLFECARSLPSWEPLISGYLNRYTEEKNLDKIVEGLTSESNPCRDAIAAWHKASENVEEQITSIDSLIREFEDKNLLNPTRQPIFYLMDALNTLIVYASSPNLYNVNTDDYDKILEIRKVLTDQHEKLREEYPALVDRVGGDVSADTDTKMEQSEGLLDTYSKEIDIGNLEKMFREELTYIAQNDKTDDIFRDVKEIGNEIVPDIVKTLGSIVGNHRFHSDLGESMKTLERRIEDFIFSAQSNIDTQIKAALDSLGENFKDRLESEIRPQFQAVSPYLALFVKAEQRLRQVAENMEDSRNRIDAFIGKFFRLPDDIEKSCENFREDFKCLAALKRCEQNAEFNSEEVEVLKHLFGANGTDIFSRLKDCESEDLRIPKNVEKVWNYLEEKIDKRYKWKNKEPHLTPDELVPIFKHAATRLEHIYDNLMEKYSG